VRARVYRVYWLVVVAVCACGDVVHMAVWLVAVCKRNYNNETITKNGNKCVVEGFGYDCYCCAVAQAVAFGFRFFLRLCAGEMRFDI